MNLRTSILVFTFAIGAAACNKTTPFPPGLDPLDSENRASLPRAEGNDPYPEKLSITSGHEHGYDWVHARGYVHAAPAQTWEAIHTPQVSADPKLDGPHFTLDVEKMYEYSYRIHYEPSPGIEFEVTWRHGLADGTDDAPVVTASRFQKTWGTTYINLLQGSVVTRDVLDSSTMLPVQGVTEVEFIEHLDATASGTDTLEEYFHNLFKNVLKHVGRPVPK